MFNFLSKKRIELIFSNKKGFTLIEALVAISILMIAIASPITIAQRSLVSSMLARDQMIANFLAQDALEGVKNIRDQIAMNGNDDNDWLLDLRNCICVGSSCSLGNSVEGCNIDTAMIGDTDYVTNLITGKDNTSLIMKVKTDDGLFQRFSYSSGANTKFKRIINIEQNPNNNNVNEARVNVFVFWDSSWGEEVVKLTLFIYNYESKFN